MYRGFIYSLTILKIHRDEPIIHTNTQTAKLKC